MAADECPSSGNEQWCSGDMNHFDLDERAFPTLATSDWGVTFTQVRPIVCPTTSPVSVVIGWGAEPYNSGYLQVHIWNHKVPIDAVAVVDAASTSYTSLTRTNYNAWEWAPGRNIVYPVMYRVTSVYGESITVNISSSPSSVGQKFDGTQQFTQWPTSVASNVCPTMFEYDIFVNGLNNGAPNHQVAESWLTGSGPNLAYSASLPSNATLAAQNNFDAYAEWGFYTPGASVPAAEIAGIELQVYAASSLSGIQLVWGEYNLGHIVNLPTVTSTWSYVYLDKGSFGAALPDIQKLAFKNSLGTAASGFTIANFRLVPTGVVVEPGAYEHFFYTPPLPTTNADSLMQLHYAFGVISTRCLFSNPGLNPLDDPFRFAFFRCHWAQLFCSDCSPLIWSDHPCSDLLFAALKTEYIEQKDRAI